MADKKMTIFDAVSLLTEWVKKVAERLDELEETNTKKCSDGLVWKINDRNQAQKVKAMGALGATTKSKFLGVYHVCKLENALIDTQLRIVLDELEAKLKDGYDIHKFVKPVKGEKDWNYEEENEKQQSKDCED